MNFRQADELGPDYKCQKCGLTGYRLWRDSHVFFLSQVELLCTVCAEAQEKDNIARYAKWHQVWETGIGNLIPARPTPEGDTFWGHTSGDVLWWYKLPQYQDPIREMKLLRIERDHFSASSEGWAADYLKAREEVHIHRSRQMPFLRWVD